MKKYLYILIAIIAGISFIVTGCGSSENKSKAIGTTNTSSTQTKAEFGQATQKQKEAGKKFVREIKAALSNYNDEFDKINSELKIDATGERSSNIANGYDGSVKMYNLAVKYYKKCDEFSTAGMEDINQMLAERCRLALQQVFQTRADRAELLEKFLSGQLSKETFNSEYEHMKGLSKRYEEDFYSLLQELEQDLQ